MIFQVSRNASNRHPEHMIFRHVSNYDFQKCWQLEFPEILAITISEMLAIICLAMLANNVSNCFSRKYRQRLSIITFRIVSCYSF